MFKKKENVVITTISVPVEMAAFFKEMKEAGINRSNVIVTYFEGTPEYKRFIKKHYPTKPYPTGTKARDVMDLLEKMRND